MNDIKVGMKFKNGIMELEVIDFAKAPNTNVALLLCLSDGLYITVRNLQLWNGVYVWNWGHYFDKKQDALDDYEKRKNGL